MRLLEQHHKRLSELLKLPLDPPSQQSTADSDVPEEDEKDASGEQDEQSKASKAPAGVSGSTTSAAPVKPVPTLPQQRRYPGRELSSSIASNLASARGIKSKYRGQPLAPSVSNDQAPGSLETRPRREGSLRNKGSDAADNGRTPSWVPTLQQGIRDDAVVGDPSRNDQASSATSPGDEGFSRFYSTFGSLINKLSAPLAFAGLPLIAEDSTPEIAPPPTPEPVPLKNPRQQKSMAPGMEPELSKIFSRATLRSLARDGHGGDSFYVVPTSGHTASYASILNHENKEKRRIAASRDDADLGDDQDEDDFVDARESQAPMLPGLRKRAGKSRSERELQNVVEELHTENASLKEMLDKLSKRLHAFELNSQSAHLALAQSVRLQRPGSPMSSSGGPADEAIKRRNRELEEQMASMVQKMGSMEKDYDKLQQTVDKYRERWEKLKAGAKARREAQDMAVDGEPSKSTR